MTEERYQGSVSSPTHHDEIDSPMTFPERLSGIYFEPGKTFQDLRQKRSWVWMVVIVAVLGALSAAAIPFKVDHALIVRKSMQENPFTRNMSDEEIETLVRQTTDSPVLFFGAMMAPVAIVASYAIAAVVLLTIFILMGASLNFRECFTVTVWGLGPPSIIATLLLVLVMMVKDPETLDFSNPANNLASNLGFLLDAKEYPVLQTILSSLDLFAVWTFSLLARGFSIFSNGRLSLGGAATGVLAGWALWVAGKIALALILS